MKNPVVGQFEKYEENFVNTVGSNLSPDCKVTFYADSGHFYLAKGITHINGIPVIQNSLPSEQPRQE